MLKVTQAWIITMSMMIWYCRPTSPCCLLRVRQIPSLNLARKMQKQEMGTGTEGEGKGTRCSTCNTFVGEAKQHREHCKSDLHKHNLKPKTRKLLPLTAEECVPEIDIDDSKADLKDYSF
ncbi:sequence-specific DNA binding transcription factor [Raphanus sativus]|nr:sequence-specific DNA binding transcription factor [Raphanus sativus]